MNAIMNKLIPKEALNLIIKLFKNFDPYYPEDPTYYVCFFCGVRKYRDPHRWNCFYSNAKKLIDKVPTDSSNSTEPH